MRISKRLGLYTSNSISTQKNRRLSDQDSNKSSYVFTSQFFTIPKPLFYNNRTSDWCHTYLGVTFDIMKSYKMFSILNIWRLKPNYVYILSDI